MKNRPKKPKVEKYAQERPRSKQKKILKIEQDRAEDALREAQDGTERPIADGGEPIRNSAGRKPINERQER